ncbi:hypothetical protein BZG36_03785 [Bifiguratus adelaidae]|uniref:TauD/TfdA-like domain-containing protein n=1 Tax=Bifiguratus adelaidae TaxID=1938954 RepID=A0A261XXG8_9FUNG|nr:hypothetical protein BZG36_03785 [Bifiguratus adelaidae]
MPAEVLPQQDQSWRFFDVHAENAPTSEAFPAKIEGPSVWYGPDLAANPDRWLTRFMPEQLEEIEGALKVYKASGEPLIKITRELFPLPTVSKLLGEHKDELLNGQGVTLLRGLPIHKYTREDQIAIFMGLGSYLGHRIPQNGKGHVLGHVKDLTNTQFEGKYNPEDPTTRIYATRKAQPFHVDGTDIVGLLCLQVAQEGGESSVISSHTVYNELNATRPDLADELKKAWFWDRKNEHPPDQPGYIQAPILVYHKGHLITFFSPHFLETIDRFPELPPLTDKQREALKYMQDLAKKHALNMWLEPGDIQWVHNHQILHARGEYTDSEAKRRHLLRLWLRVDEGGWEKPFGDKNSKITTDYNKLSADRVPLEAE